MESAEKMLEIMRRVGGTDNKYLKKATMMNETQCKVGDLTLERKNYLKPEGMRFQKGDTVIIYKLSDTEYVILAKVV